MRIIAFVTHSILTSLGEPTTPRQVAPARGPPLWEQPAEPVTHGEDTHAPVPVFVPDRLLPPGVLGDDRDREVDFRQALTFAGNHASPPA